MYVTFESRQPEATLQTQSCKAHRELPVSQFTQGKTCFHYREPLFLLQGPCFHYKNFPVNPCTSLLGIAMIVTHQFYFHFNLKKFLN